MAYNGPAVWWVAVRVAVTWFLHAHGIFVNYGSRWNSHGAKTMTPRALARSLRLSPGRWNSPDGTKFNKL